MTKQFDVCIVGGGLIGSAAACALGDQGLQVALVEKNDPAPRLTVQDDYRLRVSAINAASVQLFKSLGIWPAIKSVRVSAYTDMSIWDGMGDGMGDGVGNSTGEGAGNKGNKNSARQAAIQFHCHDTALAQLGYIIENDVITQALQDKITYQPDITQFQGKAISAVSANKTDVDIQLDTTNLKAKLLIGADGQNSRVRQLAGIPVEYGLFNQLAIVARIQTKKPHKQTAYQHFLQTGPIAYLPLADGCCSIVWSCDKNHADTILALPEPEFADAVAAAMEYQLGEVKLLGNRAAFPLKQIHAQRYIGERVALIGDAAHRTHPLAGLGANIGFLDAAAIAETITTAYQAQRDIGLKHTLRKYERWRRGQNTAILTAMQGFKTVFGCDHPGVTQARQVGLSLTNRVQPIKTLLTSHAMGLGSDLPKACQIPG